MNGLTEDTIVIDTCVFMHMMNPPVDNDGNVDDYIQEMLTVLMGDSIRLIVDDEDHFPQELSRKLTAEFKKANDIGIKRLILKYWIDVGNWQRKPLKEKQDLLSCIKKVIHEQNERVDRILVALASCCDRKLVTDDEIHILVGPPGERPTRQRNRRTRLRKETRNLRGKNSDFLHSREAYAML